MTELRDLLGVTATNITALVDGLEKDGLVTRKDHPTDRRATVIEVTAMASEEMTASCGAFRERVGELFSTLGESDQKELLRLMGLLRERLESEAR